MFKMTFYDLMLRQMRESREIMLRQTLHVRVASDTQQLLIGPYDVDGMMRFDVTYISRLFVGISDGPSEGLSISQLLK